MSEKKFGRVVIVGPTRSTCLNISVVLQNGNIPPTLLMQEKRDEICKATANLPQGGFGVVAGTGTGKTVAIRDIARQVLSAELRVDIVTRENEATDYTWTCNTLVITPGVALHWFKSGVLSVNDLIICDEIHQTSEHLELSLALAKRAGCTFFWASATIDPSVYRTYLTAHEVIECSAFDPEKKAKVETSYDDASSFLSSHVVKFIEEKGGVAVFVPTRAQAEALSAEFGKREGLYCDFYHGGEKAEKLRQFLTGQVPKPFMVFMTIAGASSLNILGLDTVVIVDEMYTEVVHSGVRVLEKVKLGNNELLQMGGRVNGRAANGQIFVLTSRSIDFHSLKPTTPTFVLGGDLETVALTCARVEVDLSELDLICQIDRDHYSKIVKRFRDRGIITPDGFSLTAYGKQIEHLPVPTAWGELLVNAEKAGVDGLLDAAIICASAESLYDLIRKECKLGELGVSGSDHLTSHNIVVSALNQFGQIVADNGSGVAYTFRGDYVKSRFDQATQKKATEKGAFIEWCDANGFSGKAIKEVAIAMKSVYRQMGLRLPAPGSFKIVVNNSILHESFLHLIAKVQSLDFVHNERNSEAGTIWSAQHSQTKSSDYILGAIRFWKDKRGNRRASIEGTAVDGDILNFYAKKTAMNIDAVTDQGVRIEFKRVFAGEPLGETRELVADVDVPEALKAEAERKFINSIRSLNWFADAVVKPNQASREASEKIWIRSGGATKKITLSDEQALYEKELSGKGVFSVSSCIQAIHAGQVNPTALVLKLEDFVSVEEQEAVRVGNPGTIKVGTEIFTVYFGKDSYSDKLYARIVVEEDFARATETEFVYFLSGRQVEIECSCYGTNHRTMSFPELVEKLEASRIKKAWEVAKSANEVSSSDLGKVISEFLPKVSIAIEVAKDAEGRPVYGYFYISYSWSTYYLRLANSLEEARRQTVQALPRLIEAGTNNAFSFSISREEPYQKKDSWGDWHLTEVGQALHRRFEEIKKSLNSAMTDFSISSIITKIEEVKKAAETAKAEIGGKFVEVQKTIAETEAEVNAKVSAIDDDDRGLVTEEISEARKGIQEAKDKLQKLAYVDAEMTCGLAVSAVSKLSELAATREQAKHAAQEAKDEIGSILRDIQYGYDDYSDNCIGMFRESAGQLREALDNHYRNQRYELIGGVVSQAINLIAEIEIVLEGYQVSRDLLQDHLNGNYSTTSFYEISEPRVGQYISMRDDDPIFSAVYEFIKDSGEDSGEEYCRLMESRLDEDLVAVWLTGRIYDETEIEFCIHIVEYVILKPADVEKIQVVSLWQAPDAERLEQFRQLRNLQAKLDKLDEELEFCGRDYANRVLIKFEQDPERNGALFAISDLPETSLWFKDDYKSISGRVRFVMNNRCSEWLEELPQAGEEWVCSLGVSPRMIGYDKKGRPIIVVNPQVKKEREALALEIEKLREQIYGPEVEDAQEEENPLSTENIVGIEVDEESSGSLGVALLKAINK